MVVYIKLLLLYVCYWIVGLEEDGFQYRKALYLSEVGCYHAAIHALKKAEKHLKTGYVYGLLGWCYIQLESFDRSLEYYNLAYKTDDSIPVVLGLAVSECHAGSISKSKEYFQRLLPYRDEPFMEDCILKLESEYAKNTAS